MLVRIELAPFFNFSSTFSAQLFDGIPVDVGKVAAVTGDLPKHNSQFYAAEAVLVESGPGWLGEFSAFEGHAYCRVAGRWESWQAQGRLNFF